VQRRSFLGAVAGATAATAGCTALSEGLDRATEGTRMENLGGGSPWSDGPVVVTVESEAAADRENFPGLVAEATDYWERNAEEYAGFDVTYEFRPAADVDDPDVRVVLVDTVTECPEHSDEFVTVGCAPLITGEAPDTARVQIKSGYSDGLMLTTIKHELGHTLGLGHDDEPAEIMSHDPAERIPDYETRRAIHDAYLTGMRETNEANGHRGDGVSLWNDRNWDRAREAYATATDQYESARDAFKRARADAADIGVSDAADICRDAREFAAEYEAATAAMRDAAAAHADGDRATADDHYDTAQEHYEAAKDHKVRNSDDLAVALGLK
jgi:hypothetical protein